jgi:hypothetical protein
MLQRESGSIKIAILGGDLLVGRSLEAALRGVGYDARFLNSSILSGSSLTDEPAEWFDGVRLVIFAPRMSTERRRAILSNLRGAPPTGELLVLELVTGSDDASEYGREELVRLVSWPCSTQELGRKIEAAMIDGNGPKDNY